MWNREETTNHYNRMWQSNPKEILEQAWLIGGNLNLTKLTIALYTSPESLHLNPTHKFSWDFDIPLDHQIQAQRSGFAKLQKKLCKTKAPNIIFAVGVILLDNRKWRQCLCIKI